MAPERDSHGAGSVTKDSVALISDNSLYSCICKALWISRKIIFSKRLSCSRHQGIYLQSTDTYLSPREEPPSL
jgi:hypothetical protein